ncbi:MAG: hypothetical protein ABIJ09_10150 [Pseudomonadota bacterium]
MKRIIVVAGGVLLVSLLAPAPASAVPVFARKYGVNCTMCHSNYPRLNDFGQRYRANGYQLPGREQDERNVLESPPPFAARTSAGLNVDQLTFPDVQPEVAQFQVNGLDLLSAGLLARNIGYMMIFVPSVEFTEGVPQVGGTIEMASVVFSNLFTPWLNVRVGRFEPAYVAFSAKRQLSAVPYDSYEFVFPGGAPLSATQTGVEVSGHGAWGLSYAAGWVNGSSSNLLRDPPLDFYLRVAETIGPGEGQTAGQRIGLVGYFGNARSQDASMTRRAGYARGGADLSLNLWHLNLALQYLIGWDHSDLWRDPNVLYVRAPDDVLSHSGFAELSYLPRTDLVAFARIDGVYAPGQQMQGDLARGTLGARYYVLDQLCVHAEYSHAYQFARGVQTDDLSVGTGTLRLDFAF